MKTVYLDTSVYNCLLKDEEAKKRIKQAVDNKKIIITASLLNQQEIALASPSEKRKLYSIAREITQKEIYEQPSKILEIDSRSFISNQKQAENIYSKHNWYEIADLGARGGLDDRYKDINKESRYHQHKKIFKDATRKISKLVVKEVDRETKYSREKLLERQIDKKLLQAIIKGCFPDDIVLDIAEIIDFSKMPRIRAMNKYQIILMESFLAGKTKPQHGDNVDMQHVVYSSDNAIFATNDGPFLENLIAIDGQRTKFMSFEEFMTEVDFLNKWQ